MHTRITTLAAAMLLALVAAVARVRAQRGPQAHQLGVVGGRGPGRPGPSWRAVGQAGATQRGRQVAARGRVARVEGLRDPQPAEGLDRHREVGQ